MSAMLTETTAGTRKHTVSEKIRLRQLEPPATPGPPRARRTDPQPPIVLSNSANSSVKCRSAAASS
jgi:hypothetical protein